MGSLVAHAPRRRPTQGEKERVVERLRDACVDERLSQDTFARRIDLVFSARTRAELDRLVADIGTPAWPTHVLLHSVNAVSRWTWQLAAAWREPRTPRLVLPDTAGVITIGRSSDCDFVVSDPTVSRRHASIEVVEEGAWQLRDLGSANGSRLNGWRIAAATDVRPGDELQLGECRFILDRSCGRSDSGARRLSASDTRGSN
jgi:FHA domain-containing protein/uncharacterized protein DUF1707